MDLDTVDGVDTMADGADITASVDVAMDMVLLFHVPFLLLLPQKMPPLLKKERNARLRLNPRLTLMPRLILGFCTLAIMDILDIMVMDTVWVTDMVDTTVWADTDTVMDTDMHIHMDTDTHIMENKSFDL